ncbi:MAG TPA: pirin family protein [Steroidobacteraceae bacterium]|nr:pirin family protein [Steroidobacteraceae bacterium]
MNAVRRSTERGHANHGWLDSHHSFSFADYFDPNHVEFGPLRVINEDRVAPGAGFGTHPHRDMEIISYVLSGELAHKDSMGTGSVIRPGDVQRMSAGSGVRHSEFNNSPTEGLHFLQIWIKPDVFGIEPSYEEKHFADSEKQGRLRLIASPDGRDGSVLIHQDASIYAGRFDAEDQASMVFKPGRRSYVHVVRGEVRANGIALGAGDGLKITETPALRIDGGRKAEVLVFDLP